MSTSGLLYAQEVEINGIVADANGTPLPGANVIEKGTTNGVVTDFDGNYSISVEGSSPVLQFSSLGFASIEKTVGSNTTINVVLSEDSQALDEVVVVGYGTMKKSDLTGAVSTIKSDEVEDLPNINILDRVQGRVAGLSIVNSSYSPGEDPKILIRGKNSLTASNDPLIILDGFPLEGSLSAINPNDIESFTVLKDGSASAIYGSRGSNGVILITTKKGKSGKPTINYSGSVGFNTIDKKLDVLDGNQYLDLRDYYGTLYASEQENLAAGKITDWQDEATRTALQYDNSLSISGATDKLNYYITGGQTYQEGIVKGSEYNRKSFRFNGSYDVRDWLEIGINSLFTNEDWGDEGDINISPALSMSPLGTPYNDDGTTTLYPIREDPFFTNPLGNLETRDSKIRTGLMTNLYADFKFGQIWESLEGLSYRFNYGRTENRENRDIYQSSTSTAGLNAGGIARRDNWKVINTTVENILNYDRQFGNHSIGITGLYSWQNRTSDATNVTGTGFVNDALEEYGIGGATNLTVTTPYSEWSLISQMGRLNYSFDSKYYFTFTVRRDGYSGFGNDNKWGVFPSMALGWTISDEGFMEGMEWVNFLKLRSSYAESGNQAIQPYGTLTQIQSGNPNADGGGLFAYYLDGSVNGFGPTVLGNPDLSWEATKTLNFGLDYSFAGDRIFGSIEYYQSKSEGLILQRLLNATQGFNSILQNIGETENNGVEITVSGKIFDRPATDFNWEASINFFKNDNKIVKLYDKETDDVLNGWFIGEDIDANFDYVGGGVYGTQGEIDASHEPNAAPGDRILLDMNNNGVRDDGDRRIQGSTSPDYTIGLNNSLSYKNFTLSFFIYSVQGVKEHQALYDARSWLADRTNYFNLDYWTVDNTDAASQRPEETANIGSYFEDRSFIRLKNITLGYDFNKQIDKLGLSNLRVYITGNNLLTSTDWEGYDPETTKPERTTLEVYPSHKSVMMGVNFGF